MHIRPATLADVEALVALDALLFAPPRYFDAVTAREVREELAKENSEIWVADVDGRVVGFLHLTFRKNSAWGRIYARGVHPDFRRQGVGQALAMCGEERIGARGLRGVTREIREDNLVLKAELLRLGYKVQARLAGYYPDGCAGVRYRKLFATEPKTR